jgi:hypothetical protein
VNSLRIVTDCCDTAEVYDENRYPRRAPRGLTPTQRMAGVLRYLAFRNTAVSSDDLRALTVDYAGESGDRKLRRDLRELRKRHLVETGLGTHSRNSGVRLRHLVKHPSLHLTRGEHAALARARNRLGLGPALVEPRRGPGRHLDLALAVVRYLEEGVGEVTGRELAERLDLPVAELHAVLLALTSNPTADPASQMTGTPALDNLVFVEEVFDDEDDDGPDPAPVVDFTVALQTAENLLAVDARAGLRQKRRLAHDRSAAGLSVSPTAGQGLDVFGRFAYSLAETRDRLDLIDRALADPGTSRDDRQALLSAGGKLAEWRGLVQQLS